MQHPTAETPSNTFGGGVQFAGGTISISADSALGLAPTDRSEEHTSELQSL